MVKCKCSEPLVIFLEVAIIAHHQLVQSAKPKDIWKRHVVGNLKVIASQPQFQSTVIQAVLTLTDQLLWWTREVYIFFRRQTTVQPAQRVKESIRGMSQRQQHSSGGDVPLSMVDASGANVPEYDVNLLSVERAS